ncbi:4Fe-4S dicluster domain-containing protein [Clostridium malenominatum]|uniref:4Fe-4S dicluster domain-containing protein n=1 Tax=Clostridium malenominatum TaxID=1539 RepID=A0ABP3U6L2_9CLOT
MAKKIIKIDEEKCMGCGLCVNACQEGAIDLVNGKAKLVNHDHCDGLGMCLPECPTGALELIDRDPMEIPMEKQPMPCGCPGQAAKLIERKPVAKATIVKKEEDYSQNESELRQWPVQLNLINTRAPYLNGANLLVAADCTAYAYANFHRDFIKDHITVIGCPKLDDVKHYEEKLSEMLKLNNIKSVTVVRMEVPCCGGIVSAVKNAMLKSGEIVPYREVTISTDGNII